MTETPTTRPTDHLPALREAAAEANHLLYRWQLVRVRLHSGLTVEQVAERMGIGPTQVVDQIERPESDPHLSTLRRYARAVGALVSIEVAPEAPVKPLEED